MTNAAVKETGATSASVFENAAHTRRLRYQAEDRIDQNQHVLGVRPIATIIVAAAMGVVFGVALGWTHATDRKSVV